MIDSFSGEYRFLSNFYPCRIVYEGQTYPSTEAAYQAAKTTDKSFRKIFTIMRPGDAKRAGRKITLRQDWEQIKLQVMEDLVRQKFEVHKSLQGKLLATGNEELIEGNNWGDKYWGMVGNTGANHLGKILMKVREGLRS